MKTHLVISATAISLLLTGLAIQDASAKSPLCDITVTGTSSDPIDASSVSIAVNGPHVSAEVTVCLNGTFDFGTTSFVSINPSGNVAELNIIGINDATIVGGLQPFRAPGISLLPQLTISDLRFENPSMTAISVFGVNERLEISSLEIDGVQSFVLPAFGVRIREGIFVSSALAEINGEIEISNNLVDGGAYDLADDLTTINAGIALFGPFGVLNPYLFNAEVTVFNNHVRNWSGTGIATIGLTGARIDLNKIEPGAFANQLPEIGWCTGGAGLGAAAGMSLVGVSDSTILNNTIVLTPATDGDGNDACNVGITVLGDNGAATADSLDNRFVGNIVSGSGQIGLLVGTDVSAVEEDNSFIGNNLATLEATGVHLFLGLGANNNSFKGNIPSVAGNVAGNSITGQ